MDYVDSFTISDFAKVGHLDGVFPKGLFSQGVIDTLCESIERYKSILRRCPKHNFDKHTQTHIFKNELQQLELLLDATTGGSVLSKSAEDATTVIERMTLSDHQGKHNMNPAQRENGIIKLNINDVILAQNKYLAQMVNELTN